MVGLCFAFPSINQPHRRRFGSRRVMDTKLLNTSRHRRTMKRDNARSRREQSERWSLNTHKLTEGLGSAWTHRRVCDGRTRSCTELRGAESSGFAPHHAAARQRRGLARGRRYRLEAAWKEEFSGARQKHGTTLRTFHSLSCRSLFTPLPQGLGLSSPQMPIIRPALPGCCLLYTSPSPRDS